MNITIQSAKSGDWKILQKLNNQVFLSEKKHDDDLYLKWPFSAKGIEYYKKIASGKHGACFIAYLRDKPVGHIALVIKDFGYRRSKYVEIENIGVDPLYRSQGIGKRLIDTALAWAKEQKATKLYVSAYWSNNRAIDFYKINGFYESGVELDRKI